MRYISVFSVRSFAGEVESNRSTTSFDFEDSSVTTSHRFRKNCRMETKHSTKSYFFTFFVMPLRRCLRAAYDLPNHQTGPHRVAEFVSFFPWEIFVKSLVRRACGWCPLPLKAFGSLIFIHEDTRSRIRISHTHEKRRCNI